MAVESTQDFTVTCDRCGTVGHFESATIADILKAGWTRLTSYVLVGEQAAPNMNPLDLCATCAGDLKGFMAREGR